MVLLSFFFFFFVFIFSHCFVDSIAHYWTGEFRIEGEGVFKHLFESYIDLFA